MTIDEQRLQAAGYRRSPILRMVRASSEISDADLILWVDESGRTLTEAEAIRQVEKQEEED